MARSTNGTSDNIDYGALSAINSATIITIAGWIYRSAAGTTSTAGASSSATNRFIINHWSDNNVYIAIGTTALSDGYGYAASSASGWNHYACVYDGSQSTNALRALLYLNGIAKTLTFAGTVPANLGTDMPWRFGKDLNPGTTNRFAAGGYAEWGIWSELLTVSEIESLSKGFSPLLIRPSKLEHYFMVIGRNSPETDLMSTTTGTVTGTTVIAHPKIIQPSARMYYFPSAAAHPLNGQRHFY